MSTWREFGIYASTIVLLLCGCYFVLYFIAHAVARGWYYGKLTTIEGYYKNKCSDGNAYKESTDA